MYRVILGLKFHEFVENNFMNVYLDTILPWNLVDIHTCS